MTVSNSGIIGRDVVLDKQLLKNIASLFGVQGTNYIIPLITLPYLVKTLGPESYGVLGFSLAFVQYFCLLTDYGFNLSATRDVAIHQEDKNKISNIFWSVMACKFMLMLLGVVVLFLACQFSAYISSQQCVIWAAYGLVIGNVLFPVWLFQGKERMALSSISNIIARLFSVPLIFFFVKTTNDAWLAALITSITAIVGGIISICLVYKERYVNLVPITFHDVINHMKDGWHVFISTAAISLYTTSITVILGFISGSTAVGYFVAADKLRQAVQGLLTPISQAIYPKLSSIMSKDEHKGFGLLRKIFIYYSGGGLILSLCLLFLSTFAIDLIYGATYKNSISVLAFLSFCPFLVAVSNILGVQTLLVLGYKKQFSNILLVAGAINMIILFPLTKSFAENGAAIAVLITEIVVVMLMMICIVRNGIPLIKSVRKA